MSGGTLITSLRFPTLPANHHWCMQLQSGKKTMEQPAKKSSSHRTYTIAGVTQANTLVMSTATTTAHPGRLHR